MQWNKTKLQQVVTNFLEICGSKLLLCFVGVSVRDHVTVAKQRNEESLALPRPEGVLRRTFDREFLVNMIKGTLTQNLGL